VGLGRFAAHRRGRLTRTSEASTHSGRVRHRTLTDEAYVPFFGAFGGA
jgi:hypothetical protein